MHDVLSSIGYSLLLFGLLTGLYGYSKATWLRREDFRWDIDFDRARRSIMHRTSLAVAWLCMLGTVALSVSNFLKP